MLFNKDTNPTPAVVTHAPMLEIIWTIIPALILILVAIPSFSLLYSIDEIIEPLLTIKVVGHQ
jgi:heme/copper-type cytochrome/quinol oxidase subunit 2